MFILQKSFISSVHPVSSLTQPHHHMGLKSYQENEREQFTKMIHLLLSIKSAEKIVQHRVQLQREMKGMLAAGNL